MGHFEGVYEGKCVGDLGVTVATSLLLTYNESLQSAGVLQFFWKAQKHLHYSTMHISCPIRRRLGARQTRPNTRPSVMARAWTGALGLSFS
jgi:hypothetical protein